MTRWIKFFLISLCLTHVGWAFSFPKGDFPQFDFSTAIPLAPRPIHYDVIFDETETPSMVESTAEKTSEPSNETQHTPQLLTQETLSFSPKQIELSEQAKKTLQNITDTMKRNPESRLSITLFFYEGTGFETAESKRLALKRSLVVKKEIKQYDIDATRVFIQIKQTLTAHTSHIGQLILKD